MGACLARTLKSSSIAPSSVNSPGEAFAGHVHDSGSPLSAQKGTPKQQILVNGKKKEFVYQVNGDDVKKDSEQDKEEIGGARVAIGRRSRSGNRRKRSDSPHPSAASTPRIKAIAELVHVRPSSAFPASFDSDAKGSPDGDAAFLSTQPPDSPAVSTRRPRSTLRSSELVFAGGKRDRAPVIAPASSAAFASSSSSSSSTSSAQTTQQSRRRTNPRTPKSIKTPKSNKSSLRIAADEEIPLAQLYVCTSSSAEDWSFVKLVLDCLTTLPSSLGYHLCSSSARSFHLSGFPFPPHVYRLDSPVVSSAFHISATNPPKRSGKQLDLDARGQCPSVLFIISKAFVNEARCRKEVKLAIQSGKRILAIVENERIFFALCRRQTLAPTQPRPQTPTAQQQKPYTLQKPPSQQTEAMPMPSTLTHALTAPPSIDEERKEQKQSSPSGISRAEDDDAVYDYNASSIVGSSSSSSSSASIISSREPSKSRPTARPVPSSRATSPGGLLPSVYSFRQSRKARRTLPSASAAAAPLSSQTSSVATTTREEVQKLFTELLSVAHVVTLMSAGIRAALRPEQVLGRIQLELRTFFLTEITPSATDSKEQEKKDRKPNLRVNISQKMSDDVLSATLLDSQSPSPLTASIPPFLLQRIAAASASASASASSRNSLFRSTTLPPPGSSAATPQTALRSHDSSDVSSDKEQVESVLRRHYPTQRRRRSGKTPSTDVNVIEVEAEADPPSVRRRTARRRRRRTTTNPAAMANAELRPPRTPKANVPASPAGKSSRSRPPTPHPQHCGEEERKARQERRATYDAAVIARVIPQQWKVDKEKEAEQGQGETEVTEAEGGEEKVERATKECEKLQMEEVM